MQQIEIMECKGAGEPQRLKWAPACTYTHIYNNNKKTKVCVQMVAVRPEKEEQEQANLN